MNMQGMMFGGEGPVMKGTWYNPSTGDVFTVRDSFFEDNNYVVATTDGRYLRYEQIQHYMQSDMPEKELKAMIQHKDDKQVKEEIPAEIQNILEDPNDPYSMYDVADDDIYTNTLDKPIGKSLGNINQPRPQVVTPTNMNVAIIEKALKNADKPEFSVNVFWEKYPFKQIEMLKDVMEIPEEEIINWYLDNIEITDVIDAIKEGIKEKILYEVGKDLNDKIETATSGYLSDLESEVKDTYGVSTYTQTCYVVDTPPKIEKPKSKTTKSKTTKTTKKKS